MCVIIHKPKGVEFLPEDVQGAFESNSHGFGVMYLDETSGEVIAKKKLTRDIAGIKKIFADLTQENAVFHFRIKTHGPTNDMFCHPFQVLNKKQHGRDMWLMHNGVISKANNSTNESDTYAYVRDVLTDKLRRDIDLVEDSWFQKMVEWDIGHSKLVFLDDSGRVVKYNESYGDEYKGCWVSNKGFVGSSRSSFVSSMTSKVWNYRTGRYEEQGVSETKVYKRDGSTETAHSGLCKLREVSIKPGDKVHIFAVQNPAFYAMGTITAVEVNFFHVSYDDPLNGVQRTTMFYGAGMTSDSSIYRLQCLPDCFGGDQSSQTFMETKYWKSEDNVQQLQLEDKTKETTMTESEVKEEKKVSSSQTGTEATAEEAKPEDKEDDEEIPFGVAVTFVGDPMIEYVGSKPIEVICNAKDFRYGGGDLDAFSVYGGDSDDDDCPETALLDIYNMEPQDRLDWFHRYHKVAFGIFQDLIEQVILDDSEVKHLGEEEVEAEEEDDESVEASRELKSIAS